MGIEEIRTDNAPDPVGPYSQAVRSGGFIFCSGQIALNPETGEMAVNGIEAETALVMDNLKAVLEAAGSSLEKVVKTTIYIRDMGDFSAVNRVYASYFSSSAAPARATVQVAALPKGAGVEIDCIALA
ncbi:MAG: RidA family protein [Candidatus Latescibacteria bacterium]|nr:RidA family protein [Candidatus Latescibacterota bacterium]